MRRLAVAFVLLVACSEETPVTPPPTPLVDAGVPEVEPVIDAGVEEPSAPEPSCPDGMVKIDGYCIDKYEAYVVEIDAAGNEKPHSPYLVLTPGKSYRAKVAAGVVPQGYISQVQSAKACAAAGKRLCTREEFLVACRGPDQSHYYPYGGITKQKGYCNEGKGSSVAKFFGSDSSKWTYENFNDPRLNQWDGGLARTGQYDRCVSPYGVHDLVGNLHEWGADGADARGRGRFRGGFYGDAEVNGHGCLYVTSAHELAYHDYSTGFRCCADFK